jgi:hypothetical protein
MPASGAVISSRRNTYPGLADPLNVYMAANPSTPTISHVAAPTVMAL